MQRESPVPGICVERNHPFIEEAAGRIPPKQLIALEKTVDGDKKHPSVIRGLLGGNGQEEERDGVRDTEAAPDGGVPDKKAAHEEKRSHKDIQGKPATRDGGQ